MGRENGKGASRYPLLITRGVQAEVLAALSFLAQVDFQKASAVAWLAASRHAIRDPNNWLARGVRERLNQLGYHWPADVRVP